MPTEGYTKIGEYTGLRGFGDHGLAALYAKTTATKVYIALVGALETNGNSFQIYLNIPGKAGAPITAKLPVSSTTGTSFEKAAPIMEMEVDYGFGVKASASSSASSIIDYTQVTAGKALDQKTGDLPIDGMVMTVDAATTGGFGKTRMAFLNKNTLTAHAADGGNAGWEIELDKADLGIADAAALQIFAAQNGGDGGFFSSDVIPMVPGNTAPQVPPIGTNANGNFATDPNFVTLPGVQYIDYVASAILATRAQVASTLNFSVYPNPAPASTMVSYNVPQGKQAVSLAVYDTMGRQVRAFSAAQSGAQSYSLSSLASGMYVVKLNVGGQLTSQKLVVK